MPANVYSLKQIAELFGKSPSWFRNRRTELESEGFPPLDQTIGGWLRQSVDAWFASRHPHVEFNQYKSIDVEQMRRRAKEIASDNTMPKNSLPCDEENT